MTASKFSVVVGSTKSALASVPSIKSQPNPNRIPTESQPNPNRIPAELRSERQMESVNGIGNGNRSVNVVFGIPAKLSIFDHLDTNDFFVSGKALAAGWFA